MLPFVLSVVDPATARSERGGRKHRESGSLTVPRIQIFWNGGEFGKNLAKLSSQFAASAERRFQLNKRSQLFIRTHNETLSVAMCVHNPDCSSLKVES